MPLIYHVSFITHSLSSTNLTSVLYIHNFLVVSIKSTTKNTRSINTTVFLLLFVVFIVAVHTSLIVNELHLFSFQIYFVGKVCCEKKVTVDLVKKKKSRGTVLLPLSHPARVCLAGTQNGKLHVQCSYRRYH